MWTSTSQGSGKLMLGFSLDRNVMGTTIRFRPVWDKFITNGKGMGMSITLRSPIEFHITLADRRRRRRYDRG